jgi:hypothetical protein
MLYELRWFGFVATPLDRWRRFHDLNDRLVVFETPKIKMVARKRAPGSAARGLL